MCSNVIPAEDMLACFLTNKTCHLTRSVQNFTHTRTLDSGLQNQPKKNQSSDTNHVLGDC